MTRPAPRLMAAFLLMAGATTLSGQRPACAAPPPGNDTPGTAAVAYREQIKPLLAARCIGCHGADTQEGGLRLDSSVGIRKGGDSGPAVVAGKVAESRLWVAVSGGSDNVTAMPPEGKPLSAAERQQLRGWIAAGAEMPEEAEPLRSGGDHWAFQPLRRPALPQVAAPQPPAAAPRNAIDLFVLRRLSDANMTPSPPADRATLIRRLSLDLRGLPPTVEEIQDFLQDTRPDAYTRLVDQLLASPHYGERWGRHWLDLARYADSNGFTRDFGREMWRYREWVIAAINANLPFDQFAIEQVAGDLLPEPTLEQRIATGFHRNTLTNDEGGTDQEQFRVDAVADRVATTGSVFLGLTLGCARCHQHKYDPVSQREFYQLFAFLNNCDEPTIDAPTPAQIRGDSLARRDAIREQISALEAALKEREAELQAAQLRWEKTVTIEQRAKLPGPTQAALDKKPSARDDAQQKLVRDLFLTTPAARREFPAIEEIAQWRSREPAVASAMVLARREQPRDTHIHLRGNFLALGDRVQPATPAILSPLRPRDPARPDRLDFARWLVADDNPLTPRVIVNRWWQRFFGEGLVATENDFGLQGTPPTHPELLDYLASELVANRWNMKALHRLIVTSATYRQASAVTPEVQERDPRNQLLARQSRLRLEAEVIRDAALTASGLLTRQLGGPSVHPPQPEGVFQFTQDPKPWTVSWDDQRFRRGMYTYFWRSSPYPSLMVFDFPDSNVTCTRRVRSNTPLQALTLANDVTFTECAMALADALHHWQPDRAATAAQRRHLQLRRAFLACLGRSPRPAERQRLEEFFLAERQAYLNAPELARQLLRLPGRQDAQQARETGALPRDAGPQATANGGAAAQTQAAAGAAQPAATGAGETLVRRPPASHRELAELAAWTTTARVLMNLDEFITRD